MKCSKCNEEVAFGKYHVSTPFIEEKALDFNYYLYFDEYNPDKKPIRLAKRGFYIEGYYCNECGNVWLNFDDNHLNMKCTKCKNVLLHGRYEIIVEGPKGCYLRLHFRFSKKEKYLILDKGICISGYYCYKCNQGIFNKNDCTKL